MGQSTLAGIITAVATVLTALGGLVLAFGVLIPILRVSRTTHKIVNQQRTDMQRYIRALSATLRQNGIELPVDQSIDPDDNV